MENTVPNINPLANLITTRMSKQKSSIENPESLWANSEIVCDETVRGLTHKLLTDWEVDAATAASLPAVATAGWEDEMVVEPSLAFLRERDDDDDAELAVIADDEEDCVDREVEEEMSGANEAAEADAGEDSENNFWASFQACEETSAVRRVGWWTISEGSTRRTIDAELIVSRI